MKALKRLYVFALLLCTLAFVVHEADGFEKKYGKIKIEYQGRQPYWDFENMPYEDEYILEFLSAFEITEPHNLSVVPGSQVTYSQLAFRPSQTATTFTVTNNKQQGGILSNALSWTSPLTLNSTTMVSPFTVLLSNYQWVSSDADAQLVLAYSLTTDEKKQPQDYTLGNKDFPFTIFLDNVFFNVSSRTSDGGPVEVILSGSTMWAIFPHFNSSLSHTGYFGFVNDLKKMHQDSSDSDSKSYNEDSSSSASSSSGGHEEDSGSGRKKPQSGNGWVVVVLLVSFIVVGSAGAGAFVWVKKRQEVDRSGGFFSPVPQTEPTEHM